MNDNGLARIIYNNIVEKADGCGLSIRQMCMEASISNGSVQSIKNGRLPTVATLEKISNVLKVGVSDLLIDSQLMDTDKQNNKEQETETEN